MGIWRWQKPRRLDRTSCLISSRKHNPIAGLITCRLTEKIRAIGPRNVIIIVIVKQPLAIANIDEDRAATRAQSGSFRPRYSATLFVLATPRLWVGSEDVRGETLMHQRSTGSAMTHPNGTKAKIVSTVITMDCVAIEMSPMTPAATAISSKPHLGWLVGVNGDGVRRRSYHSAPTMLIPSSINLVVDRKSCSN